VVLRLPRLKILGADGRMLLIINPALVLIGRAFYPQPVALPQQHGVAVAKKQLGNQLGLVAGLGPNGNGAKRANTWVQR